MAISRAEMIETIERHHQDYQEPALLIQRYWPSAAAPQDYRSYLGGWPALPADVDWPKVTIGQQTAGLNHLAQIDLAEVPAFGNRHMLPHRGRLSFFMHAGFDHWRENDPSFWRVVYSDDSSATSQTTARPKRIFRILDNVKHQNEYYDPGK